MSDLVGNTEDLFSYNEAQLKPTPAHNKYTPMQYTAIFTAVELLIFLAHLSRTLIGELIVYIGIRRPTVRRPSTFSNDISPEAVRPILSILQTMSSHLQVGGTRSYVFYSSMIRTLVAMVTYSFHRLIMGKVEIDNFC